MDELLEAARRGVHVRLILDPSEDATTLSTTGLPNQPLASELVARSAGAVHVRWYRTHGERFHAAAVAMKKADAELLFKKRDLAADCALRQR